jgi:hypothetical protein
VIRWQNISHVTPYTCKYYRLSINSLKTWSLLCDVLSAEDDLKSLGRGQEHVWLVQEEEADHGAINALQT